MWLGRVTYDHLLPLHKRQCLVTTNLPSLHPFSFHEMIFILVLHKVRLWQKLFGKHEYMNTSRSPSAFCSPLRFKRDYDPITNTMMHVYKGGYWEGKYSRQWGVEFPRHILVILLIIN